MRSFEESLKRLKLESVDILHIHDPDEYWEQALTGAYPAVHQLRSEGVIRVIGVGMNQSEMLVRFAQEGDFDCFLLVGRYTLLDHTALAELLPLCLKRRIGVIVGAPFNSGILVTGARPGVNFDYVEAPLGLMEKLQKIQGTCERHKVPFKAAALQLPLAHPAVVAVIAGSRSGEEVEGNFRLISHPIPSNFWKELRDRNFLPP